MLLLFFVSIFLYTYEIPSATTNCKQLFTFLALTESFAPSWTSGTNLSFWIGEDVGGECYWSHLIQIAISDGKAFSRDISVTPYPDWDSFRNGLRHFQRELPEELVEESGVWHCSTASFTVKPPPPDSVLLSLLRKAVHKGNERWWNQNHGLEGILQPIFEGIKIELIHYYEAGLYVGYQLSKVYYFSDSKYILIFTHQPMLASGLDTMHGFLLFKIRR